jgi:hypothetical protein
MGTAYCTYDLDERDTANHFLLTMRRTIYGQSETPSKANFTAAHSAPLALATDTMNVYPANNTSSFTFTVYSDDFTTIYFWHRIDADSLNDGGVVEFSTDGGPTWITF